MKKWFGIAMLMVGFSVSAFSQENTARLSGKVVSKKDRKPIEFVSVILMKPADSTVVSNTVSETDGRFLLENIPSGNYLMRYSFFGYLNRDTLVEIPEGKKNIELGTVFLSGTSVTLKEAVVVEEGGRLYDVSIDRKTYYVEKDLQATSGSASDVLKNVPSVDVSMDGDVSLRGSTGVMILINGKVSPLMKGKSRAEALQQLPANSIERIEVITNPSAKYKPDGNSGIINIVLKKDTRMGVNGTVTANAGTNDRYNGNFLVNYKPGKVNMYLGGGLRQNSYIRYSEVDRNNLDSLLEISTIYTEDNSGRGKSLSKSINGGIDYEINQSNSLSLSGDVFNFGIDRHNTSVRKNVTKDQVLDDHYERLTNLRENTTEGEATLAYQHKFDGEDHTLDIEAAGAFEREIEDNYFTNFFRVPMAPTGYDNVFVKKSDDPKEIIVDYAYPVSEDAALEAGYSGNFNKIDVDYFGEKIDTATGLFTKDMNTSYFFKYRDMIHAGYVTWEQGIEDFGVLAGIRVEKANLEGNVVNIDSTFKNDYFSIYPSLHLSYELEDVELQLNYSRRVNRPDGDELNPFPEYDDPQHLYAGNPKLLPEYVHSVELGMDLKKDKFSFIPAIYYRYTYNGFTDVTKKLNDSTLLTTMDNLSSSQYTGLELILTGKPVKWLSGNLTGNIFYNEIDASNLGYSSKKSIVSFNTTLNANITAGKNTMFQLTGNYRSARLTPQGENSPSYVLNVGARQEFFQKKLAVTLTVSDIFKTMRYESAINTNYFNQTQQSWRDSRVVFLGVRYRFGSMTKKQREESMQFDNSLNFR